MEKGKVDSHDCKVAMKETSDREVVSLNPCTIQVGTRADNTSNWEGGVESMYSWSPV